MKNEFQLTVHSATASVDVEVFVLKTNAPLTKKRLASVFAHMLTECHREMMGLQDDGSLLSRAYRIYPIDQVYAKERSAKIRGGYLQMLRNIQWDNGNKHATMQGTVEILDNLQFFSILPRVALDDEDVTYSVFSGSRK